MENQDAYSEILGTVAKVMEAAGVVVMVLGLILAMVLALRAWRRSWDGTLAYTVLRRTIGGSILVGLEILVAGDLIRTVTIDPDLKNVVVLGIIVLIRTFLSFSLEIEIEGSLPWRRALTRSGVAVIGDAVKQSSAPRD
jgi:uncharacterized membrane protein